MTHDAVTLAADTIHNPAEPRHFMRLKPVARRIRVLRGGAVLADSRRTLRLLEVGRDLYDPVIYLPRADISAPLVGNPKRTRCPLKGEAAYFDLAPDRGRGGAPLIGWTYPAPPAFAAALAGLIAFYPDKVTIEESP